VEPGSTHLNHYQNQECHSVQGFLPHRPLVSSRWQLLICMVATGCSGKFMARLVSFHVPNKWVGRHHNYLGWLSRTQPLSGALLPCNPTYGDSMGRGAWTFATGKWTTWRKPLLWTIAENSMDKFKYMQAGQSHWFQGKYIGRLLLWIYWDWLWETFFGSNALAYATPKISSRTTKFRYPGWAWVCDWYRSLHKFSVKNATGIFGAADLSGFLSGISCWQKLFIAPFSLLRCYTLLRYKIP
jgi:hypothetical protein